VTSEIWDQDHFLLRTPSGTVDLRTGDVYEARPEDFITKLAAVAPSKTPDCPLWLKFPGYRGKNRSVRRSGVNYSSVVKLGLNEMIVHFTTRRGQNGSLP
jgi:hypothetical protein